MSVVRTLNFVMGAANVAWSLWVHDFSEAVAWTLCMGWYAAALHRRRAA